MLEIATNRQRHTDGADDQTAGRREKRVHLTLPPRLFEKMKEIQEETNADTLVNVVTDALVTYLALVKEYRRGREIIVRDKEKGQETTYALFMRV